MKQYENYMNRQTVSDSLHQRLLSLEQEERRLARRPQARRWLYAAAALAACLLLAVGVGRWALPWLGMGGSASDNSAAMSTEATSAGAAADSALPEEAAEGAASDTRGESVFDAETTEDTAGAEAEGAETASEESAGAAEDGGVPAWEEIENPAWLPEGYSLASTEIDEATGWYRATWTDGAGGEIQLESAPETVARPEGVPVLDPADEGALDALSPDEDGWWRFLLAEEGGWRCFSTNGDLEILWQAVTGLSER